MKNLYTLLFLGLAFTVTAQRNVILIIADDLGTDYCGFYEDHLDTAAMPNIRRLLSRGVLFTNAMSNPLCSPTRAGILTGRYSFRTGVGDAVEGPGSAALDTAEIVIPRLLKDYNPSISTANIGKWHLHPQMPATNLQIPNLIGYDYYAGNFIGALANYYSWNKVTNGISGNSTTYATTETADDAISWIKNIKEHPFFLWLAFNAPHTPFHLPPSGLYSDTSLSGTISDINAQPKEYFKASLEALDHEIGRLFDSLIVLEKWDSTEIIFMADNGNAPRVTQSTDTSRSKGTIYQPGIHVPLIISGPSVENPGRFSNALVNTQDLFPTILNLMGNTNWQEQIPETIPLDGKSILPVLKDQSNTIRPWAFSEIFKDPADSVDGKAIRNMDYKLLSFDDGRQEFYNLSEDPNELNDLLDGELSMIDVDNYNFLCNEINDLVGSGNFCNSSVGVKGLERNEPSINIFPIPFNRSANIVFSNEQTNSTIRIIDILGNEIFRRDFSGHQLEVQRGEMKDGIYFLQVMTGKEVIVVKKIILGN